MEMEEKVYKANRISLELLEQLNSQIIIEYGSLIYYPVKSDEIDCQLADYLNNYPDRSKLLVMFVRESPGVYLFGTKKVFVKVYNNRIMVRVGGGYLSIDEFLEQYTVLELEKMEQRGGIDIKEYLSQPMVGGVVSKEDIINDAKPAFANSKYQNVSRYSPKVYMKANGRASPNGIAGRSSPGLAGSNNSTLNMTASQMKRS